MWKLGYEYENKWRKKEKQKFPVQPHIVWLYGGFGYERILSW